MTRPTASTAAAAPGLSAPPTPPGPRLPAWLQTALYLRDPLGFLRRCRRRYGEIFTVSLTGVPKVAYVANAELAHRVFATDRDIGRAGAVRKPFLEPVLGYHSLLCLDGDEWMRQRKLLGSAFHGKRIQRYHDDIAEIAAAEVQRWPVGEPFALRPRMQTITLAVILRIVFGIRDTARAEALAALLPALADTAAPEDWLATLLPPPVWRHVKRWLGRIRGSSVARHAAVLASVDELIYEEIADRRAERDRDDRADILAHLLRARDDDGRGLTDVELRDALMTLLEAGHETTATALSWAFERLVRHPDALARLTAEVAAGDQRYLDAVIHETLRVRPVVPEMPRALTEPLALGGYRIPPHYWVSPSALLVHDDEGVFAEPQEFNPERFLDVDARSCVPFGGGRRQCLGSQFALLEMRAVIPQVLARLELHPAAEPGEAAQAYHVTLTPARGGRIVASAR